MVFKYCFRNTIFADLEFKPERAYRIIELSHINTGKGPKFR